MRRAVQSFAIIMILSLPTGIMAEQRVSIEFVDGYAVDYGNIKLIPGAYVVLEFRMTNTNGIGCAYEPSSVWQVYSPDGALWSDLALDVSPSLGPGLFDDLLFDSWGVTGSGADTVGVSFLAGQASGLIDGSNELTTKLGLLTPSSVNGQTLCLDTVASQPDGFDWAWRGLNGCEDVTPEWGDLTVLR